MSDFEKSEYFGISRSLPYSTVFQVPTYAPEDASESQARE